MRSPVDILREAVEAWRREEARERVWRWRRAPEAASAAEVAGRHGWLGSTAARDALGETVHLRLIGDSEHGALRSHLARASAESILAEGRDALGAFAVRDLDVEGRAARVPQAVAELSTEADPRRRRVLARALERAGEAELGRLFDLRARADEAAAEVAGGGPPHPDAGPAPGQLLGQARALLERTDDIARDAVESLLREVSRDGDPSWADLVHALRAPTHQGLFTRRDRWRRIASGIAGLGLERELSGRVRIEASHGGVDPRPGIALHEVPMDVRLGPSPLELGLLSELASAEALGRGLAAALASPGLPVELRRPVAGTVGRAFGTLLAQLVADDVYLRRCRGLGGADRERARRQSGRVLLLETRLLAAAHVACGEGSTPREHVEAGAPLLRRALCVEVAPAVVASVVAAPAALGPRLRGRLAGFAAAMALRERFDEDWFRNPRAHEPLRAGAARGGLLSAEAWCCDDLAAEGDVSAARLIEISA